MQLISCPIATNSNEGVVVAPIHEVKPNSIEHALDLYVVATGFTHPLLARTINRPRHHLTTLPLHRDQPFLQRHLDLVSLCS